nr:MAG TPA: hypothetical protein [Caudoviricetes sp.]
MIVMFGRIRQTPQVNLYGNTGLYKAAFEMWSQINSRLAKCQSQFLESRITDSL